MEKVGPPIEPWIRLLLAYDPSLADRLCRALADAVDGDAPLPEPET